MNEKYMKLALKEAKKALKSDDVPVGAIIVKDGKIISKGYNQKEKKKNPIKHAEIIAIEKACKKLKTYRLNGCLLYVTLEPCAMCAGAIINARIKKVYYSTKSKKFGFCGTIENILINNKLNHKTEVSGGILEDVSASLLVEFFKNKRK